MQYSTSRWIWLSSSGVRSDSSKWTFVGPVHTRCHCCHPRNRMKELIVIIYIIVLFCCLLMLFTSSCFFKFYYHRWTWCWCLPVLCRVKSSQLLRRWEWCDDVQPASGIYDHTMSSTGGLVSGLRHESAARYSVYCEQHVEWSAFHPSDCCDGVGVNLVGKLRKFTAVFRLLDDSVIVQPMMVPHTHTIYCQNKI